VLICLLIVTVVSGALLKLSLAERDVVRAQEHRLQSEWLAQAGVDRALARLVASPTYAGEQWKIKAADLGLGTSSDHDPAAVVAIAIEKADGSAETRLIKVQADFPPDSPRRVRHTTRLLVDLGSLKTGASR
jgi:hypothetical protein